MKRSAIAIALTALLSCPACQTSSTEEAVEEAATAAGGDWIELFDGESLKGWKANENPDSWSVREGQLVANGPRSHLFYIGDETPFKNFVLEAVVLTRPKSNSGIYFHTRYQDAGWPKYGFEVQVNNSYDDPQKTGSIYGVRPITEAPAKDNEWFTMRITVEGKGVLVQVDNKVIVDYKEPPNQQAGKDFTRVLAEGTFALQAHDPGSEVHYRSIRVRRLP